MGLSIIVLFQNCGDVNNNNVISVTDVKNSYLKNLPFAFESQIDQISYMSCSGQYAAGNPSAFTFKAGGYSNGSGIKLKDNYTSKISHLSARTQELSLQMSERNYQTGAVLSIRERNNLQRYLDPDSDIGEVPLAKMMFNEVNGRLFSSRHYAKHLLSLGPGNYMNYIPGLSGFLHKSFDGSVRIANNTATADAVRNFMMNSHYLTITYPEAVGEQAGVPAFSLVRSPYNTLSGDTRSLTSVFGKGYALSFQQFDGRMPDVPSRVLSVDHAVNLENQNIIGESWDCGERFVVVRPEDASRLTYDPTPDSDGTDNAVVCPISSDPIPANAQEQKRLERIRNILPVESWYVHLPSQNSDGSIRPGCIVPKGNDFCYDMEALTGGNENNPNVRVAYYREEDPTQGWNFNVSGLSYTGRCGAGTIFVCPHFVSICHKTN